MTELQVSSELHGRDDEIRRVFHILPGNTKNNPILIGEPGTISVILILHGLKERYITHYQACGPG